MCIQHSDVFREHGISLDKIWEICLATKENIQTVLNAHEGKKIIIRTSHPLDLVSLTDSTPSVLGDNFTIHEITHFVKTTLNHCNSPIFHRFAQVHGFNKFDIGSLHFWIMQQLWDNLSVSTEHPNNEGARFVEIYKRGERASCYWDYESDPFLEAMRKVGVLDDSIAYTVERVQEPAGSIVVQVKELCKKVLLWNFSNLTVNGERPSGYVLTTLRDGDFIICKYDNTVWTILAPIERRERIWDVNAGFYDQQSPLEVDISQAAAYTTSPYLSLAASHRKIYRLLQYLLQHPDGGIFFHILEKCNDPLETLFESIHEWDTLRISRNGSNIRIEVIERTHSEVKQEDAPIQNTDWGSLLVEKTSDTTSLEKIAHQKWTKLYEQYILLTDLQRLLRSNYAYFTSPEWSLCSGTDDSDLWDTPCSEIHKLLKREQQILEKYWDYDDKVNGKIKMYTAYIINTKPGNEKDIPLHWILLALSAGILHLQRRLWILPNPVHDAIRKNISILEALQVSSNRCEDGEALIRLCTEARENMDQLDPSYIYTRMYHEFNRIKAYLREFHKPVSTGLDVLKEALITYIQHGKNWLDPDSSSVNPDS